MLAHKDMVVLKQSLATRLSRSALASSAGMFGTSIFMAQMPDGGISAGAHPAFRMYEYQALRSTEDAISSLLSGRKNISTAHEAAIRDYQAYALIRNYIEFAKAGQSQGYFPTADSFVQFALMYDFDSYPRSVA